MHGITAVLRGFALKSEYLAKAAMPQPLASTTRHGLPTVLLAKSEANCSKPLELLVTRQGSPATLAAATAIAKQCQQAQSVQPALILPGPKVVGVCAGVMALCWRPSKLVTGSFWTS